MELLPTELREQLPKLYEQEGTEDKIVHLKYFFPAGNWTWFVIEGEPEGDDFLFFGYSSGWKKNGAILHFNSSKKSIFTD
jgi:hypothetical protein